MEFESVMEGSISSSRHSESSELPRNEDICSSPAFLRLDCSQERIYTQHLKWKYFGPTHQCHAASQIHSLLRLPSEGLMLIGHDDGLSLLDVFPPEWSCTGKTVFKRPDDAQVTFIWEGESVHQMSVLKLGRTGHSRTRVLALVGYRLDRSSDIEHRVLRLYNLESLDRLANWVVRRDSTSSSWDSANGLPLRWARDFIPCATPSSPLYGRSIRCFTLWNENSQEGRGSPMLAISVNAVVLLYEILGFEESFRFVKTIYPPFLPTSMTFFEQHVQSTALPLNPLTTTQPRVSLLPVAVQKHDRQLSLFVTSGQRAGWIRLADSAYGEIRLPECSKRKSIAPHAQWTLPTRCALPVTPTHHGPSSISLLTFGSQTHIFPYPLPDDLRDGPLCILHWSSAPKHVVARACSATITTPKLPFLQIVAMTKYGTQVREIPLPLGRDSGSRQRPVFIGDIDGDTGFLCMGSYWDTSNSSLANEAPVDTFGSGTVAQWLKQEEGFYGWYQNGPSDWRIFWAGGPLIDSDD